VRPAGPSHPGDLISVGLDPERSRSVAAATMSEVRAAMRIDR
jgi:hypothetical protein